MIRAVAVGVAYLMALAASLTFGAVFLTARAPASASTSCRPVPVFDSNSSHYLAGPTVVYADSGTPQLFLLCRTSAADWSLRVDRSGSDWCGITGSIGAAWLACEAGGPGPHEVFRIRCLADGSSEFVYLYGESSWGRAWDNWLANAGPAYGWLISTSPSRPDRLRIAGVCN